MDKNISVSYLDVKNVTNFFEKIKNLNVWCHVDVMDGKFVKNSGVDMEYIKEAKKMGFFVDTHLMVEKPIEDNYINTALLYGTDSITIHYEIENFEYILSELNKIKKDKIKNNEKFQIGISLKPDTDVSVIKKYKDKFDLLLLMSVNPGFGGQKYISSTDEKIKEAKKILKNHIIQIDGGINFDTFSNGYLAGVDNFVMGSYFSKSTDILSSYKAIEILVDFCNVHKKENIEFEKTILQITPDGYGKDDILLGITSPNLRKLAVKWYSKINFNVLKYFINSQVHEHRKFALFCLSKIAKIKDSNIKEIIDFIDENLEKINNWDLTDEVAPNVIGKYVLALSNNEKISKLDYYLKSENFWIRRIGIVSCLLLAKTGDFKTCFYVSKSQMYSKNHLIQKAVGWLLREVYKKEPKKVVEFLVENKISKKGEKIGKYVISYVSEKMTKDEKNKIKN